MKGKTLRALVSIEGGGARAQLSPEERLWEAKLNVYGPQCAAWLVRAFKREFRTKGAMQFVVYEKKLANALEKRPQFFIGFDYLRRQKRWHGELWRDGAKRVYCIYHLTHAAGRALLVSHRGGEIAS